MREVLGQVKEHKNAAQYCRFGQEIFDQAKKK